MQFPLIMQFPRTEQRHTEAVTEAAQADLSAALAGPESVGTGKETSMTLSTTTPPDTLEAAPPPDTPQTAARESGPRRRARPPGGRQPPWARAGLAALLIGTSVLYLWGLGASGYGNEYYAAAVQAATKSWTAFFFGSLDAGNAITVDKPAFFLWPMDISARIFGLNSWSLLVPQALEGVAAVALLAAAVRRVAGPAAGLAAGAILAVTPVAVLMFRFDNPDALLTLLLTAAAYATVRSLSSTSGRSTRWLALAGLLVGLGFITKMGQALLVVPALAGAYLWAASGTFGRRVRNVLLAGIAMIVGAGWWIAIVQLVPASDRPYIGGSTTNSVLELAIGYNGLGRLLGGSGNGGGGGYGQNASFGGATGIERLFSSSSGMATEIAWLLPTALLALAAGVWLRRGAPRTDLPRAALVLFGGWLVVTGLVFSYMQGTIHPYYTVALAPAIAAIVAVTGRLLWDERETVSARVIAAVLLEVTVIWDAHLLGLTPTFLPWLPAVLVLLGTAAAVALVAAGRWRRLVAVALLVGVVSGAGGTVAYAASTAAQPHSGSVPSSGPVASGMGMAGSRTGGGTGGTGGATGGATGTSSTPGGSGDQASPSSQLVALLTATTTRWAAATDGSQSAAPLQLASGKAVMSIGGFTGSDAYPTLAQFQAYVAAGLIHYFIAGGQGHDGGPGGSSSASEISSWVESSYSSTTVDGVTVYDLSTPTS